MPSVIVAKAMFMTCECCLQWRKCKMFATYVGAAWVCARCRKGE